MRTPAAAWTQDFLPLWSAEQVALQAEQYGETARYNIAPTQRVSCVRLGADGRREWSMLRWGLVPSWADDLSIGSRMINARSETVGEKPSFKKAYVSRRCLIPADGYYEWQDSPTGKQPFLIERAGGGVMAMAGLWECNRKINADAEPIETCTVLTTAANDTIGLIHHRMPVLLDAQGQSLWMDGTINDAQLLQPLLHAAPESYLTGFPVSKTVNNARNDGPQCIERVTL